MPRKTPPVGTINWVDLTIPDATTVSHFYEKVVGWKRQALTVGDHDDYCMQTPVRPRTVAGICHARGTFRDLPPQWLMYITVADLGASLRACRRLGGKVLTRSRPVFGGRFAVIADPAGAVAALFQPAG